LPQLRLERATPVEAGGSPGKLKPGPGRSAAEVADHQRARIHRALIESVAERGYGDVSVRGLVRAAGVSSKTFYERFSGKEECLLSAHRDVARRMLRRVAATQAGASSSRERISRAVATLALEWSRDPQAARLMLIDVYTAGPAARKQGRRMCRSIESQLDDTTLAPFIVEAVVAGLIRIARARLLEGRPEELAELGGDLGQWALTYHNCHTTQLHKLDHDVGDDGEEERWGTAGGDLPLLLSATAKLVVTEGWENVTTARILATSGVSRRSLEAHFDGPEDCVFAVFESKAAEVTAAVARARASGERGHGAYRATAALCARVAGDEFLAGLCFGEMAALGGRGVQRQERLVSALANSIVGREALRSRRDDLSLEASAGAVHGILKNRVAAGLRQWINRLIPALSYLTLAPEIGPSAAVEVLKSERQGAYAQAS
jgi:AcrR family transcriptional regulator